MDMSDCKILYAQLTRLEIAISQVRQANILHKPVAAEMVMDQLHILQKDLIGAVQALKIRVDHLEAQQKELRK